MKKLKTTVLLGIAALGACLCACSDSPSSSTGNETKESVQSGSNVQEESDVLTQESVQDETDNLEMLSYATITETDDWGPSITKIVVEFTGNVGVGVSPEDFTVSVKRTYAGTNEPVQEMSYETFEYAVSPTAEGERTIVDAYPSDVNGMKVQEDSSYITLVMESTPTEGFGNPIGAELETGLGLNVVLDCNYTIQYTDPEGNTLSCSNKNEDACQMLLTDKFTHDQSYTTTSEDILNDAYENDTLYYASYEPEDDGEKHALIIWLHGMGEGGTDTRIPLLGNKANVFAGEEFQNIMGGAYVLVPQSPTIWMNVTGATYDLSAENSTSMYTQTLMELIENYVAEHEAIDTYRIIIGGCSNGGYMTMNMIINFPEYFAAAFPICEAYTDEFITDEQINGIKDMPIWFTHAADDTLVVPDTTTVPTYNRLVEAGAENIHFTFWTNVHDTSGRFTDDQGNPEVYFGHGSWRYMLDNECTLDCDYQEGVTTDEKGSGETIFEWISQQSKTKA